MIAQLLVTAYVFTPGAAAGFALAGISGKTAPFAGERGKQVSVDTPSRVYTGDSIKPLDATRIEGNPKRLRDRRQVQDGFAALLDIGIVYVHGLDLRAAADFLVPGGKGEGTPADPDLRHSARDFRKTCQIVALASLPKDDWIEAPVDSIRSVTESEFPKLIESCRKIGDPRLQVRTVVYRKLEEETVIPQKRILIEERAEILGPKDNRMDVVRIQAYPIRCFREGIRDVHASLPEAFLKPTQVACGHVGSSGAGDDRFQLRGHVTLPYVQRTRE